MADKRQNFTNSDGANKRHCTKPMKLEMKGQIIKFGEGEIQNRDIYRKFCLSASPVATVPKEKFRILEIVKKTSPFLSTVVQKCDELTAEMENILMAYMLKLGAPCPSPYGIFR
jgi:hypothetical protein